MRVGFNARLLYSPETRGWNRYSINLLAELASLGVELFLYSDRVLHQNHLARLPEGSYRVQVSPPMRYLFWEQRWLPQQCASDQIELLHTPFNFGLPWFSACPRVLTLHDAIDQVYSGRQKNSLRSLPAQLSHWMARTRAHKIITVSAHAKRDLMNHLNIPPERIAVVYEAADPNFHRAISNDEREEIRRQLQLLRPYILYVGGWERRKNIPFLMRSFAAADLEGVELVLAGGHEEQRQELITLAQNLGVIDRVRFLGWVEDSSLPALYAEASCFVYPSQYEGFGLQLCEAMAVGCPTLAASATALPEVLGHGGETFPLDDPSFLSSLLRQLTSDHNFRNQLSQRARERSNDFSWHQTALLTIDVYRGVLQLNR